MTNCCDTVAKYKIVSRNLFTNSPDWLWWWLADKPLFLLLLCDRVHVPPDQWFLEQAPSLHSARDRDNSLPSKIPSMNVWNYGLYPKIKWKQTAFSEYTCISWWHQINSFVKTRAYYTGDAASSIVWFLGRLLIKCFLKCSKIKIKNQNPQIFFYCVTKMYCVNYIYK